MFSALCVKWGENQKTMWDLLKLALILGVTIYLLTRKWDLGLILLIDSLLVGVLYLYPPLELLRSIGQGLVAVQTLKLCGAVFLVLVLAELLRRTASMLKMVNALQVLVPDGRIVLAIIPAVIGMMPMIGGAMFSAPMVDGLGTRLKASPWRKTFVNYWFRHSMEYVFPLYQSLLLVSAILGISVYTFIGASYPLTLAMVAGGVLWGLVGLTRPERESVDGRRGQSVFQRVLPACPRAAGRGWALRAARAELSPFARYLPRSGGIAV